MFVKVLTSLSEKTGHYFIDSKKLPVCDNQRIHSNKELAGFATRGKSSTGWFYGLKIHRPGDPADLREDYELYINTR